MRDCCRLLTAENSCGSYAPAPEEQHIIGEVQGVQKGTESGKVSVQFLGGHGGIWRFALSALTLRLERPGSSR